MCPAACASSSREVCRHSSINSFATTLFLPAYAVPRAMVFVSPRDGGRAGRGAETRQHKAAPVPLALGSGTDNPLVSLGSKRPAQASQPPYLLEPAYRDTPACHP